VIEKKRKGVEGKDFVEDEGQKFDRKEGGPSFAMGKPCWESRVKGITIQERRGGFESSLQKTRDKSSKR